MSPEEDLVQKIELVRLAKKKRDDMALLKKRYEDALHAMQSGAKQSLVIEGTHDTSQFSKKHLTVGEDQAILQVVALAEILVSKGVVSKDLYIDNPAKTRSDINSVMAASGAILKVLFDKGVCTEEEYMVELIALMENEVKTYERALSMHYNKVVTLR